MKGKKGNSIAIVLLVLLVLLLVGTTLFIFVTEQSNVSENIASPLILTDNIDEKEKVLDLYLQDIVDQASRNSDNKGEFIQNMNLLLDSYKNSDVSIVNEFEKISEELNEESVNLVGNKFEFSFKIRLENSLSVNGKKQFSIESPYERVFK